VASDRDEDLPQPAPGPREQHEHTADTGGPQPARPRGGREPGTGGGPRGRRPRLTVALVAGAVLVAGGGAYWAAAAADHPSGPADSPPPLALSGWTGSTAAGQHVELIGTLPDGPASAHVFTPAGQVSRDRVAALAGALHVTGAATLSGGLWKAAPAGGRSGPTLQVNQDAPGGWAFARAGAGSACKPPAPSGLKGGAGGICYGAVDRTGAAGGTAISEAQAKKLAAPVLAAAGLSGAAVDASQTSGGVRSVTADPVVGGLLTHGWSTTVQFGPDGTLLNGAGRLTPLAQGASYPVVGARAALDALGGSGSAGPGTPRPCGVMHPQAGGAGVTDAGPVGGAPARGSAPCQAAIRVLQVHGAVFGLSAQYVAGRPELVPSWLFRAGPQGGRSETVAQPAVEPRFIVRPGGADAPAPTAPVPGGPAAPVPVPPSGHRTTSLSHAESYTAADRTLTLKFWGGVCSTYAAKAVSQGDDAVRVRITATVKDPGKKCVMLAKAVTVKTVLDRPLAGRTVYDDSDGHRVGAS